jgi:hypothetical protein
MLTWQSTAALIVAADSPRAVLVSISAAISRGISFLGLAMAIPSNVCRSNGVVRFDDVVMI